MSDPVATEKAAELAAKEKLDLGDVKHDGDRITVEDVRKAIAERKAKEDAGDSASSSTSSSSSAAGDDEKPAKKSGSRMPERAHKEGCPMDPARVEIYDQPVPPKTRSDGQVEHGARIATMAHCVECGATTEI